MLNLSVSPGPVLVLALVNFLLSWLWYSPVLFVKPWLRALKLDPNKSAADMTDAEKQQMPWLFLNGLVTSCVLVWALAILVLNLNAQTFLQGAQLGVLAWVGFTLTASLGTLWEGRAGTVLLINNGLYLLTYALFGGVLAIWH